MLNLFWCFHSFPVLFWKSLHVERSLLLFPPFLLLLLLRWFSSPVPGSFPTHTCGYKAGLPSFCYLFFCWGVFGAVWFLVFWPSFFIFASWFLDFSFVCLFLSALGFLCLVFDFGLTKEIKNYHHYIHLPVNSLPQMCTCTLTHFPKTTIYLLGQVRLSRMTKLLESSTDCVFTWFMGNKKRVCGGIIAVESFKVLHSSLLIQFVVSK